MKWVTRDHVHMDRVASPWLIRRFIDRDAVFGFLPFGNEGAIPGDAIAFAIPGVEIGPHDRNGSTFRKLKQKYGLTHPAIEMMAEIIESGITHVFHHGDPGYSVANLKYPQGMGLDAVAIGMMYATGDDAENLEKSMAIYDGLFAYCRVMLLLEEKPEIADIPPPQYWHVVKDELSRRP
jgi:hypothetical protein